MFSLVLLPVSLSQLSLLCLLTSFSLFLLSYVPPYESTWVLVSPHMSPHLLLLTASTLSYLYLMSGSMYSPHQLQLWDTAHFQPLQSQELMFFSYKVVNLSGKSRETSWSHFWEGLTGRNVTGRSTAPVHSKLRKHRNIEMENAEIQMQQRVRAALPEISQTCMTSSNYCCLWEKTDPDKQIVLDLILWKEEYENRCH